MGKLAEIKTQPTAALVDGFIENIPDKQKLAESRVLLQLMEKATNEKPKMWGSSLVGFGDQRYESPATGREVDWFRIGFSPRKANISLHLGLDVNQYAGELAKPGKHKTGVGCLYINKLADVDLKVLEQIIKKAALKK